MIKFTKNVIVQALDCAPTPIVIVDARKSALPIMYVNPAVESLSGRTAADLTGLPVTEILAEGRMPGACDGEDDDPGQITVGTNRQRWHTADGLSVALSVRVSPLQERNGRLGFWMFSVVGDAAPQGENQPQETAALRNELVDARREIKNLQRTDAVTGLANRAGFDAVLDRDWAIARREQRRIGVIVFSIDGLAEYREIFGRHATDSLVQKIGHAISGTLRRAGDFGARLANDRFAVLISESAAGQAEACANRIAAKVRNLAIPHPRSTMGRFATVSFGTASEIPPWTKKSVTLLDEAERCLDCGDEPAESPVTVEPSGNEEVVS